MKTTIITAALCIAFSFAQAQHLKDNEVPANITAAFAKKYPNTKAKWEKEGADYEAEFDLNKTETSAVFDATGNFKELEQEIKVDELPKAATGYCAKNYAGYKLEEAAKITEASGKIMYEAEMKKGKEHFDAIFDQQGNFIKKSESSMKEEGKD